MDVAKYSDHFVPFANFARVVAPLDPALKQLTLCGSIRKKECSFNEK